MKKEKVIKDGTTEYDWIIFAQSYFYIARLACQELLLEDNKEKHNKNLSSSIGLHYRPADLYIAILFNIKHGIEIFIKSLSILDVEEYERGHDTHILFQNFKKRGVIKLDTKDLEEMEELIIYFYKPSFLKPKIEEFYEITDTENDIFRYPDNSAKLQIQWELIIGLFNISDVQEIKNKLDELLELFNKAGFKIQSQNSYLTRTPQI